MRIPVLVTLSPQEASRTLTDNSRSFEFGSVAAQGVPPVAGLVLDRDFPLVSVGGTYPGELNPKASFGDETPVVVTRGTIDADRIAEIGDDRSSDIGIFADPRIGVFRACGNSPPNGTAHDVARCLAVPELARRKLDGNGVALAIMDAGISLSHLHGCGLRPKFRQRIGWNTGSRHGRPGSHIIGHGTMCAYDALLAAPAATLFDFPILKATSPKVGDMSGYLSNALRAYAYLLTALRMPSWKFRGLVVSNSWGLYHSSWDFPRGHPGRYGDNPNHPFNVIVATLARAGADIVFAAGNCGDDCPDGRCQGVVVDTIVGANAHPDVLTIAGCDVEHERAGYSSQGPGIAGMASEKPDLTAYTHFLGSQVYGQGSPDCGTSAACAVAAGCIAAIRTRLPSANHSPGALFSMFRSQARGKPTSHWNKDYGRGIIQPIPVADQYGL